jgi:hypothetical protein
VASIQTILLKWYTIESNKPSQININVTIIEDVENNTTNFKATT